MVHEYFHTSSLMCQSTDDNGLSIVHHTNWVSFLRYELNCSSDIVCHRYDDTGPEDSHIGISWSNENILT